MNRPFTLALCSLLTFFGICAAAADGAGDGGSCATSDGGTGSCSDGGASAAIFAGSLATGDAGSPTSAFGTRAPGGSVFSDAELTVLGGHLRRSIDEGWVLPADVFRIIADNLAALRFVESKTPSPFERELLRSERWRAARARGYDYVRAYVALTLAQSVPAAQLDYDLPSHELVRLASEILARDFKAPPEHPTDDLYLTFAALRDAPEFRGAVARDQFARAADALDTHLVGAAADHTNWRLAVISNRNVLKSAAAGFGVYVGGASLLLWTVPDVFANDGAAGSLSRIFVMAPFATPVLAGMIYLLVEHLRRDRTLDHERAKLRAIGRRCGQILTAGPVGEGHGR